MSEDKFKRLLDASSFGTPEAKAAMASVPQERVDKVLARVEELRRESAGAELHGRMTQVFIPGRPAPQGSKRHLGNGIMVESSKAVKPWRVDVAWAAREAFLSPMDGPVRLELGFVMPRPKSAPKKSTPAAIKRPDLDKLVRAVMDAITGVVVVDDSQIVHLVATKRIAEIGEQSGVELTAYEVEAVQP